MQDAISSTPLESSELGTGESGSGDGSSAISVLGPAASGSAVSVMAQSAATRSATVPRMAPGATILGDATTTWYVRPPSGGQYGPADGPTMGQWIKEGRVAEASMVWRDGWSDWRVANEALASLAVDSWASAPAVSVPRTPNNGVSMAGPVDRTTIDPTAATPKLSSSKRVRGRMRLNATVLLSLVFLGLVAALVVVVWFRSGG